MDQVLLRFYPASIDLQEFFFNIRVNKEKLKIFFLKKIKNKKLKDKIDCFKIGICKQPSTKNKVPNNGTNNLLTRWQVHQICHK